MRVLHPVFPGDWRSAIVIAAAAIAPAAVHAQGLPGGIVLGMTLAELQQVQPGLKPIPHPARLAGGLVGSWSGDAIEVAGVPLTPTFFFAGGQLRRVEYLAREGGSAAFGALLVWERAIAGKELLSSGQEGQYASWANEQMDVYLQLTSTPRVEQVRLVARQRVLKEAGEL